MTELLLTLLPVALGIVLSPLAIMALVAVLLSDQARTNGVAFLVGWTVALVGLMIAAFVVFGYLEIHHRHEPPLWVPILRLVVGAGFLWGALRVYQHGVEAKRAMSRASTPAEVVAAAPQLPGWLKAVETFRPMRSGLLGFGIFALNPVDASCAIVAALDLRLADVSASEVWIAGAIFALLGVLPIAAPVVATLIAGPRADPWLGRARTWIASHTSMLNAALLVVIAALQIQKGLAGVV